MFGCRTFHRRHSRVRADRRVHPGRRRGLQAQAASVAITATTAAGRAGVARPAMDERPGVIEIDLVDGTRLRVDAFVNERALRRVLAALKTAP